jgi:hypothetical protein
MPYDADGTEVYAVNVDTAEVIQVTNATHIAKMNDETHDLAWGADTDYDVSGGGANATRCALLFPELRDITAYFWGTSPGPSGNVQTSTDTTNGYDGTWSSGTAVVNGGVSSVSPGYRSSITGFTASAVKGIRFPIGYNSADYNVFTLHLFGKIASGNDNVLELWHPTSAARVGAAHFDWGNVPRGSSADITFRVKNKSATLTANSITVSMETATDTTPSVAGQHTISQGGSYASTQNIGNLAPGALSGVLTLRRTTPSNAALSLWAGRVKAIASSWT